MKLKYLIGKTASFLLCFSLTLNAAPAAVVFAEQFTGQKTSEERAQIRAGDKAFTGSYRIESASDALPVIPETSSDAVPEPPAGDDEDISGIVGGQADGILGLSGESSENVCLVGETGYPSLTAAINAIVNAQTGGEKTVTLTKNLTETVNISSGEVILDLGGYTLSAPADEAVAFKVSGGADLTIENGTISNDYKNGNTQGINVTSSGDASDPTTLLIESDVTVEAYEYAMALFGISKEGLSGKRTDSTGLEVTVNGRLAATDSTGGVGIFVEGNSIRYEAGSSTLTVDGATIEGGPSAKTDNGVLKDAGCGIQIAGAMDVIIESGMISGATGINVRAGDLTVNGGIIKSTATESFAYKKGSGTNSAGGGIVISEHSTGLEISTEINEGNISGYYAAAICNPQEKDNQISLAIDGGIFTGVNPEKTAILTDDDMFEEGNRDFVDFAVSGGSFSSPLKGRMMTGGTVQVMYNGTSYIGGPEEVVAAITENLKDSDIEQKVIDITVVAGCGSLDFGEYGVNVSTLEGYGYESAAVNINGQVIEEGSDEVFAGSTVPEPSPAPEPAPDPMPDPMPDPDGTDELPGTEDVPSVTPAPVTKPSPSAVSGSGHQKSHIVKRKTPSPTSDGYIIGKWIRDEAGRSVFLAEPGKRLENVWRFIFNPYADISGGEPAACWFHFAEEGVLDDGWFSDTDGNVFHLKFVTSDGTDSSPNGWNWVKCVNSHTFDGDGKITENRR